VRGYDHDLERCEPRAITEWDKAETRTMKRLLVELVKWVGPRLATPSRGSGLARSFEG
jgi:hypothetical protein